MRRFDSAALYAALDAERCKRELSWAELGRIIRVAPATMQRLKAGGRLEVDGMIAMVSWLGRPVEEFVRDVEF